MTENRAQRTDHDGPPRPFAIMTRGPDDREPTARGRARAFCPLSSVLCHLNLVGLGRLERPTSRLSGVRSNQLSYRPKTRDQRTDNR
jgi:hypothetical protein